MTIHRFDFPSIARHLKDFDKGPRRRHTIRTELAARREELLALREQGWRLDDLSEAYQRLLEGSGWPNASRSYVTKVISHLTGEKDRRCCADVAMRPAAGEPATDAVAGLIPVFRAEIGGVEVDAVNARDLHAFLEAGKDFSNWIKDRIEKFGFQENQDFVCSPILASKDQPLGRGGHNRLDYTLTLDMAKELSMVERTDKGRRARRYFIEIERRYYAGESSAVSAPVAEIPERSQGEMDAVFSGVLEALFHGGDAAAESGPAKAPDPAITFLDPLLPLPLPKFLAMAQQIYDVLRVTRPATDDPAALPRESIQEAARIAGANLNHVAAAFGGNRRRFWVV